MHIYILLFNYKLLIIKFTIMKTITTSVLAMLFAISSASVTAQTVTVLNFEDEDETYDIIDHLHTDDWQTNPAYTRNTFAINPNKTGVNSSDRCASFAGYNSGGEWWYGLDIVLTDSIPLTPQLKYVHAMMMTSNTGTDVNKGLLLLNSGGGSIVEKWTSITGEWADYVFPIPDGAVEIREFRFMFNHQMDVITYLDELIINNDPTPRVGLSATKNVLANKDFMTYAEDMTIQIMSSAKNLNVEVYSVLGKLIYAGQTSGDKIEIPVNEKGLYLVKGNQFTEKILVK